MDTAPGAVFGILGVNTPCTAFPSLWIPPGCSWQSGNPHSALARASRSSHAPYLPNPGLRLRLGADKGLPDPGLPAREHWESRTAARGCLEKTGNAASRPGDNRECSIQPGAGVGPHRALLP